MIFKINTTTISVIILAIFVICGALKHEHHFVMPPVSTAKEDEYVCSTKELDFDDLFIENVLINADRTKIHHVTTGFCKEPTFLTKTWSCGSLQGHVCNGDSVNLGTFDDFTKENAPTTLPKNVSVRIGKKTDLKYLVIQVHFRHVVKDDGQSVANVTVHTTKKKVLNMYFHWSAYRFDVSHLSGKKVYVYAWRFPFYFQSYSLINTGHIPANQNKGFFSEVACPWRLPPVYAHRYFVHTHHHGYFVEGFLVRNGTWTLIGSQRSMHKETDYLSVPGEPLLIQPGDSLVSRCFYLNPDKEQIQFGLRNTDEMCNFDIDFGYDPKYKDSFKVATACETKAPTFSLCDHKEVNGLCV